MRRKIAKIRLSLQHAGLRSQVSASYALMAVLPILGLCYLIWAYVDPAVLSHKNTALILLVIVAISICGFILLSGVVKALSDFRDHLKAIVDDRILDTPLNADEPADGPPPESLEDIVYSLIKHNSRLSDMFSEMEEQTWSKTRELKRVNLELQKEAKKHREVEKDLRKSNMQLSDALTKLTEMQQSMMRHERLSALGELASGIAHDINNALMPAIGFAELILEDGSLINDKGTLLKMVQDILEGAREASDVVSKLRSFYRHDATLNFELVEPGELVSEVEDLTSPRWEQENQATGNRIEFSTDVSQAPSFTADRCLLRDALVSVIMNAVDAMPGGGKISLTITREGDSAQITVTDNGAGMSQQTRDRCLEPFYTTKGPEATGMGLAIVYGSIRRHAGSIEIDSETGKGTTIRIRIPIEHKDPDDALPHPRGVAPSLKPLKILVIDDDMKARSTLETILKPGKHTVTLAESGKAGIKKAVNGDFDVIITDRAMPDLSGDEVALEIRKVKPDTPIIMVTGFGDLMHEQHEKPEGVDRVISKPVDSLTLRWALSDVTAGSDSEG